MKLLVLLVAWYILIGLLIPSLVLRWGGVGRKGCDRNWEKSGWGPKEKGGRKLKQSDILL